MSVHKNMRVIFILLFCTISLCFIPMNSNAANKPSMKMIVLAQVKKPSLSKLGVVTWTNVVNAKKYHIQLYKNGSIFGPIHTATDGKTGYNILLDMRSAGTGSYSVKVTAKGDGTILKDGQQSAPSNSQVISKAIVTDVNLSKEGIATWKSNHSTSDELKLYKDKNLIDTEEEAISGGAFIEMMRNNGEGAYYITVTPKSATGLIIDGNESSPSNQQTVAKLEKISRPKWAFTTISWVPDKNASSYEIKLFCDNDLLKTQIVDQERHSIDFGAILQQNTLGVFRVTARSIGTGLFLSGEESSLSPQNVNPPDLAPMDRPVLSPVGDTSWTDIANAARYKVQLYHDGMEMGSPVVVDSGEKGCNFSEAIKEGGPGSYTVSVTPLGYGTFHDGEPVESNEQVIGPVYTFNGTVENTFVPLVSVNKNKEDIVITKVEPNKGLEAGVETKITVEIEYSLKTQDMATLTICSNWGADPSNCMESTNCDVYKGNGKLRFIFKITPKKWGNGEKFWIMAALRGGGTWIAQTKNYILDLVDKKRAQGASDSSGSTNKTVPQNSNGYEKFTDLLVKDGVTVDRDLLAYLIYIDNNFLPPNLKNLAKYSYFSTDTISDDVIMNKASSIKNDRLKMKSYGEDFGFDRVEVPEQKYFVVLFYDDRLNLIGYYVYDATAND